MDYQYHDKEDVDTTYSNGSLISTYTINELSQNSQYTGRLVFDISTGDIIDSEMFTFCKFS